MKKYIYINYFSDKNPGRREEYLTCIRKNLSLDFIDGMIIFLEDFDHQIDLPEDHKIQCVEQARRMEFRNCLEHAQANLAPGDLVIILNLDIYLEDSDAWRNIEQEYFLVGHEHKAMVCQRHNVDAEGNLWIEQTNWQKGDFCDAWILRTPIDERLLQEDIDFCVGGAPQCDNLMMYLMSKYYHVFYWGDKYRIFHLDNYRKIDSGSRMIVNDATDWRPSRRKLEHINISAYQDWDQLLIEKQRPKYQPTWRFIIVEQPKVS